MIAALKLQTGIARNWFALGGLWKLLLRKITGERQATYVRPDMLILGKLSLVGFYPVSAVLADDHIYDVHSNLASHGFYFRGQPNRCTKSQLLLWK